jgi:hypothetical protein
MPQLSDDPATIALREMALALAAGGCAVFPCRPNKRPCTEHGFQDASRDPGQIARWFDQPWMVIGVATGEASGIAVLDVDSGKVPEAKTWLSETGKNLPESYAYMTKSGGRHVWFQYVPGMRNSAGRISKGIDVRADGGYAIFWPCTGLPVLSQAPLAPWPEWLAPKPEEVPATRFQTPEDPTPRDVVQSLKGILAVAATAGEGQRNNALYWSACRLAEMIQRAQLSAELGASLLIEAAGKAGLAQAEALPTIRSAFARGGQK